MALTVTMRCDVCGETREYDDASPGAAVELATFAEAHSCVRHGRKRLTFSFAPEPAAEQSPVGQGAVGERRRRPWVQAVASQLARREELQEPRIAL